MTIVRRLREIAFRLSDSHQGASEVLREIARELEQKAESVEVIASEIECGNGKAHIGELQQIASSLGAKV